MKIKKLLVLVSMLAVMFSFAGCGENYDKPFNYNDQEIAINAMQAFMSYEAIYDEYIDYYLESGTEFEKSAIKGINQAKETDKVGQFEDFTILANRVYSGDLSLEDAGIRIENNSDYVTVVLLNHAANRDVEISVKYVENPEFYMYLSILAPQNDIVPYDVFLENFESMAAEEGITTEELCKNLNITDLKIFYFERMDIEFDVFTMLKQQGIYPYIPEEMVVSAVYSKKELVGQAGMNTLIGMGTVFIVLIFISFIISLFKYLPALFAKKPKVESKKADEPKATSAPVAASKTENLADDAQLVAIITAAIYAYEAQSGNGAVSKDKLVVRSIKRVRK